MKNILLGIALTFFFAACDKMNDLHQPYLDKGEDIYLGKVDLLEIHSGKNRVKLTWKGSPDPKVESYTVYYDNRSESKTFPVSEDSQGKMEVIIDELSERSYTFEVISTNSKNQVSLPVEKIGKVYGVNYNNQLINRAIKKVEWLSPTKIEIVWYDSFDGDIGTVFTHYDSSGSAIEQVVMPETEKITIEDFTTGLAWSFYTKYQPTENALDIFMVDPTNVSIPEANFAMDKSKFSQVLLPNDTKPQWNDLTRLWNGTKYSDGMANWGNAQLIPWVYTMDLGVARKMSKVIISSRENNKGPKGFQIWGIKTDDINSAATTLAHHDPGFTSEMESKGWIRLYDNDATPQFLTKTDNELSLKDIVADKEVRYIRFVVNDVYTSHVWAISEVDFYWAP